MGGGIVTDGLWLHREIEGSGIRTQIEEILAGRRERLERSAEPVAAPDGAGTEKKRDVIVVRLREPR